MDQAVEVWRGGVQAWELDHMGHMNVRFYAAHVVEGLAAFAGEMGLPGAFAADASATLAVRGWHVRYLREARVSAPLRITAGVLDLAETHADLQFAVFHTVSGEPAGAYRVRVAHVAVRGERAFPWPARVRAAAAALTVEPPKWAEHRGLQPLSFAEAFDSAPLTDSRFQPSLRGAVLPQECDVFGRMRPDALVARDADGGMAVGRGLRDAAEALCGPQPKTAGNAVVEYRARYFAAPRAGDQLRSVNGVTAIAERTFTVGQVTADPFTGRIWAASETLLAAFDLAERKSTPVLEADRAVIAPRVAAPLAL